MWYKKVSKVTVVAGEMVKISVIKKKFSQLNDKRFYFLDGIVSLPFHLPVLAEINQFKQKKGQRVEKYFWEEKEHLFSLEKQALKNHSRLYLYHQILMSVPKIFNISQKNDFTQQIKTPFKRNTKEIIFRGRMDNEMNYSFDAKFEGNILVVGRTRCGKTTFVKILGKNKMFGEIKEVTWLLKIPLSREREKKY